MINAGTDATIGSRPVTKWRSCSRAATCADLPGVTLLAPGAGAGGGGGGIGVTTEAELIGDPPLTGASDAGQDAATNACASGRYLRDALLGRAAVDEVHGAQHLGEPRGLAPRVVAAWRTTSSSPPIERRAVHLQRRGTAATISRSKSSANSVRAADERRAQPIALRFAHLAEPAVLQRRERRDEQHERDGHEQPERQTSDRMRTSLARRCERSPAAKSLIPKLLPS